MDQRHIPEHPASASPSGPHVVSATIDGDRLVRTLFWVSVSIGGVLVLLDALITYGELIPIGALQNMVNITREDSIGTWFSSLQFFSTALVLGLIYCRLRHLPEMRWTARGWGLLAVFFLYLSMDDAALIHERVSGVLGDYGRMQSP